MEQSEKIIQYIKNLRLELANQDIDNPYLIHHKHQAIDELVQNLITHHGYKDEQAVWNKITELSNKEQDRQVGLKLGLEQREAKTFKQEQMKKTNKSHTKIRNKKRPGLRM